MVIFLRGRVVLFDDRWCVFPRKAIRSDSGEIRLPAHEGMIEAVVISKNGHLKSS